MSDSQVGQAPTATETAAFDWQAYPRRINMGCGWDRRDGYLNVDLHEFHHPDLVADVRDCAMLPAGEYDEIVAQDILEHLSRADALPALREWARLLRTGGHLVLRLPDLVAMLRLFERSTDVTYHAELVQCLYGTQAYDGDWHSNGFTELLLRQSLHDTGFEVLSLSHHDEWLFDVVAERTDHPAPVRIDAMATTSSAATPAGRVSPESIPTESRMPGGRWAHRIVARLVARQTNGVAMQTNAALERLESRIDNLTNGLARLEAARLGSGGPRSAGTAEDDETEAADR